MFLFGCDKNDDNIFLQGNIVGFVNLVDEAGNALEDKSGVNVIIDGLSVSDNTNENGRFELIDVPAGTYNLLYNKTAYGTYKRFSYQFIGGNIPAFMYETTMCEQPNVEIESIDVSFNNNTISVSGKVPEASNFAPQAFINDSSNVSNINYDYATNKYGSGSYEHTEFVQDIHISQTPYSPGDKIYLVIYFINPMDKGYYDYEKDEYVYSSCKKASDVKTIILE